MGPGPGIIQQTASRRLAPFRYLAAIRTGTNMADRTTVPLAALQAARRSVKNTGTLPVA